MLDFRLRNVRLFLYAMTGFALVACGHFGSASKKMANVVSPYKIDVIQGNVVTREQLAALQPGMPKMQVRDILGSALLASVFHTDRWDYVFTLRSQGREPQVRHLTVYFKNDVLERTEADALPSEAEFVATLKSNPLSGPLPALVAADDKLQRFPPPSKPAVEPAKALKAPDHYPPLEPAGR